ncbi:MAG: hypothetical protein WD276_00740 [Actinomycetota bacterium]
MTGWDEHRKDQLRMSASASPLQRLRWLEEALEFAYRAGAIRREETPAGDDDRASRDNA